MLRIIISFLIMGFLTVVSADTKTALTPGTPAVDAASASAIAAAPTAAPEPANPDMIDIGEIQKVTGLTGHYDQQTNSYKIVLPRNDLNIIVNGVKLSPAMGLTSWAVFQKTPTISTVKADVVVTENQVNTILSLALDNNLAVIALHNHMLWESPKVMFVHIEGAGTETQLASAIKIVFDKTMDTKDEASDFPLASIDTADTTLNSKKIDQIMGTHGEFKNGVYQILISRNSKSEAANKGVIINTAATFAGSDEEAVIDGDFALRASDLHGVLDALHKAGIAVVALHEHESISPQTRVVYLHYFGVGKTATLAKGVRKALDVAKTKADAVARPSVALLITPQTVKAAQNAIQNKRFELEKKSQS